jgi:hypothetical protein
MIVRLGAASTPQGANYRQKFAPRGSSLLAQGWRVAQRFLHGGEKALA